MDKDKISDWIDGLTQDLVDPAKTLENCLRKTLILAYNLENDNLRTWIEHELNGYIDEESIPNYRKIKVQLKGKLIQERYGGVLYQTVAIPIESSNNSYLKNLYKSGYALGFNVSRLEQSVIGEKRGVVLNIPMPVQLIPIAQKLIVNYTIESLWISIPDLTIIGMLSDIKTNLLQFLLQLNQGIGQNQIYSIMETSKKVDEILQHTIGVINAENVVFSGNNYQSKGNNNLIAQGKEVTQNALHSQDLNQKIEELTSLIKAALEVVDGLSSDDKTDINHELQAIEAQVIRVEPRYNIIGKSLQVMEALLVNVASNAYTPIILQKIQEVLSFIQ